MACQNTWLDERTFFKTTSAEFRCLHRCPWKNNCFDPPDLCYSRHTHKTKAILCLPNQTEGYQAAHWWDDKCWCYLAFLFSMGLSCGPDSKENWWLSFLCGLLKAKFSMSVRCLSITYYPRNSRILKWCCCVFHSGPQQWILAGSDVEGQSW